MPLPFDVNLDTRESLQTLGNRSFDEDLQVNAVEVVNYDPAAGVLRRQLASGIYTIKIENNANGDPLYMGKAAPGTATSAATWQIQKFTYDAGNKLTDAQWADGNTTFDNVWNDRASLSYS